MIRRFVSGISLIVFVLLLSSIPKSVCAQDGKDIPREWIDPDTLHRVIRLSDEPGSASLYFHQNAYTPDGEKLIITTPTGLSTINLKTRAIEKVVDGRVNVIITGRKTGNVYYTKNCVVYATDLNTKVTREIAKLPARGSIATVNADETQLGGAITETAQPCVPGRPPGARPNTPTSSDRPPGAEGQDSYPGKGDMMERRLASRTPMQLFSLNVKTGEVKTLLKST